MATFSDPSQTVEMAVCPYNEHHVMKRNRLPYHLIKCAKNNAHLQLMVCPYNRAHRVCSNQFQKHLEQCPQNTNLSMRDNVNDTAAGAKQRVDFVETVENQVLCEWDDSDIAGFTVAASRNEDVTEQLNMDKINFSKPVHTHREGDSIEEETPVDRKPVAYGIGRGKIFCWSGRDKVGTNSTGRRKAEITSQLDNEYS